MLLIQPSKDNISTEWKDIVYYDVTRNKKQIVITKDEFEHMVNDTFEALQTDKYGDVKTIWTKKYVFNVKAIIIDMNSYILKGYLREWC